MQASAQGLEAQKQYLQPCLFCAHVQVLYASREHIWKITDFGASAVATSKRAEETSQYRGTASYRAPELIADKGVYTNKVDMWALGCILYELVATKKAFRDDWQARGYSLGQIPLPSLPDLASSWPSSAIVNLTRTMRRLLEVDWGQRPSAAKAADLFTHNRYNLETGLVTSLLTESYELWKLHVEQHPKTRHLPTRITKALGDNRADDVAIGGWWDLVCGNPTEEYFADELREVYWRNGDVSLEFDGWKRLVKVHPAQHGFWGRMLRAAEEPTGAMELVAILEHRPDHGTLLERLTEYLEIANFDSELRIVLRYLISKAPGDWKLLHRLAIVYEKCGGEEFAVKVWAALLVTHPHLLVPMNLKSAYRSGAGG